MDFPPPYGYPLYQDLRLTDSMPVRFALKAGESVHINTLVNGSLFILDGRITVKSEIYRDIEVKSNRILFLSAGNHFHISSADQAVLLVIGIQDKKEMDANICTERLFKVSHTEQAQEGVLPINAKIGQWITDIETYYNDGLKLPDLYRLKVSELILLLKLYYSDEDLASFFSPIVSGDHRFSDFVFENWRNVKSVKQLAELSSYSEKGFGRKFKEVFGLPSSVWLNKRRAEAILYELNTGEVTLKELAERYQFSTPQQLNEFCVRNFGKPPGEIVSSHKNP